MLLKFEKFVLEVDNVWVQEKMLIISIFALPDNAFTAPLGVVKSRDRVVKSKTIPTGSCILTLGKLKTKYFTFSHNILLSLYKKNPEILGSLESLHLFLYVLARTYMAYRVRIVDLFIISIGKFTIDLIISVYLSSLPVAHLSDSPRRRLVVTGDSARIQDETTENSAWFFNVLGI